MHEPGERGALPETATTVARANGSPESIQDLSWGQNDCIAVSWGRLSLGVRQAGAVGKGLPTLLSKL